MQKQNSTIILDNQGSDGHKVQFQQSQCSTKASFSGHAKRGKTAKMATRPKPIEQNDDFRIGARLSTGTHAEYQGMLRNGSQVDPRLTSSTQFTKDQHQPKKSKSSVYQQQDMQVRPWTEHQDIKFSRRMSKTKKDLQRRVEELRVQRDLD